jgi:peptidoglycan/LPS O-acetylase OafA/YrhL
MTAKLSHRREIQGLRALAVIAVITNHLFANLLPGGFLGVDIFFLLSGYLITEQLMRLSASGNIGQNLLDFYARRIRRILPSALLVIWATVALAFKYLGPVIGNETLRDARWATLFFANSHFNSLKVDYFGAGDFSPLLQHYWSLAVEEQFYIVWPVVVFLIVLIFKVRAKNGLLMALSAFSVISLLTIFTTEPTMIYFSTATRLWELSLGAFFAIIGTREWPNVLQWAALLIVVGSLFAVSSRNQIPGPVVIPVLLSVSVLLNISNKQLSFLLGNRVMHYLGDLSFVLYLWHWPMIELHRQLAVSPLTTGDSISILLITFILAIFTHHAFENPLRFNKYLTTHPGVTVIFGTAALVISVITTYLCVKG